jgi:hypothetical protein
MKAKPELHETKCMDGFGFPENNLGKGDGHGQGTRWALGCFGRALNDSKKPLKRWKNTFERLLVDQRKTASVSSEVVSYGS